MGIEHSEPKEGVLVARCPGCDYLTTEQKDGVFYCCNPLCDVEQLPKLILGGDNE